MSKRLCSSSELARLLDVTRQAISAAVRSGSLAPAAVGKRIDAEHPAVREYLQRHGLSEDAIDSFVDATAPVRGPGVESEEGDFADYAKMTFEEIFERFGTLERFQNHLDAYKVFEQVIGQRLKNEELSGKLISRELVQIHVFGALESFSQRLLRDFPKTITRQLYAAAKNGTPVEESEKLVRKAVSSHLEPAKKTAERALRDA